MQPFSYARASDPGAAIAQVARDPGAAFIAGGTELLNLMRDQIRTPGQLVDINRLPLAQINAQPSGLEIGGLARLSNIAADPAISAGYPVLTEALLAAASPQVRNMATLGGNLLQGVRCPYFRDVVFACNRRAPGSGCSAMRGENRWHAILGGSESCIAVHPSDPAVALVALDAVVHTAGPNGERSIAIEDFHLLPGATPERETVLEHGELITFIEVPATPFAQRSHYLKVRDRASFEFAVVSVAAALAVDKGVIREARVALGGVAPRPWRARAAEEALRGEAMSEAAFGRAAEAAVQGAQPRAHNGFKVELAKRAVVRALSVVGGIV